MKPPPPPRTNSNPREEVLNKLQPIGRGRAGRGGGGACGAYHSLVCQRTLLRLPLARHHCQHTPRLINTREGTEPPGARRAPRKNMTPKHRLLFTAATFSGIK